MAGILDMLGPALSGGTLQQLSNAVGTDENTAQRAAMAALPVILGAMNRNTNDPQRAQSLANALDNDHDGGIFDNLGGFLGMLTGGDAGASTAGLNPRSADGTGILGHIFGNQLPQVQQGVGKATGLDSGQVMKMMVALAPMVMGYLGRQKREQNLNAGGLSDLLNREASTAQQAAPNDLMGMLGGLLDRDGDGSAVDDLLGSFLGR